jgi:hypothetical protein
MIFSINDDLLTRIEKFEEFDSEKYFSSVEKIHARDLIFSNCTKKHAVQITRIWHSRLPNTQSGPWMFAFKASFCGVTYMTALWNNPSARTLPKNWIELRRLTCTPDTPKNSPSRFLSWMVKYFKKNFPKFEKCISYQDKSVHKGTIYSAAGWNIAFISKSRIRDRTITDSGTNHLYRCNLNGIDVDMSEKIRWEKSLL